MLNVADISFPSQPGCEDPSGDPCDYAAQTLVPFPFWLDKPRSVVLKAGGGDALISSVSLCAKWVVQNRVKIHAVYLYKVVTNDDELRQSSYG